MLHCARLTLRACVYLVIVKAWTGGIKRPAHTETKCCMVPRPHRVLYYSYSKLSSTMLYDETKVAVLYDSYNTAGSFDPPTQNIYSPVTHVIHFLECQSIWISWLFSRTHNDGSLSWPNVYTFFSLPPHPTGVPHTHIPHPTDHTGFNSSVTEEFPVIHPSMQRGNIPYTYMTAVVFCLHAIVTCGFASSGLLPPLVHAAICWKGCSKPYTRVHPSLCPSLYT